MRLAGGEQRSGPVGRRCGHGATQSRRCRVVPALVLGLALFGTAPVLAQETPTERAAAASGPVTAPGVVETPGSEPAAPAAPVPGAGDAGALLDAGAASPDPGVASDAGGAGSSAARPGDPSPGGPADPSEPAGAGAESIGSDGSASPDAAAVVAPTDVIRTLLGLVLLLALAWLGGLPAVRRLEERLGISQMVTSGLPFVGLGLLMHAPGIDVLSDETLVSLTPLLQFGLGWIGFHTGFQFEARAMDEVPRGTGTLVILLTSFPFVLIALSCGLVIVITGLGPEGVSLDALPSEGAAITIMRDAAIVGLAGALSAPTLSRVVGAAATRAVVLSRAVGVLDDVFGVIALACLAAWLRPDDPGGWSLPGVGWVFVTFGMSVTLGLVVYALLRNTDSAAERSSLLLGSVCFTAGMAGAFELPPLVVCFLAGVLLRNLPGEEKADLLAVFDRLERPIYLVFLLIVGALWRIDDWRGWVLLPVFLAARIAGRYLGASAARGLPKEARPAELDEASTGELVTPPMGQLAIAFVVTAQALYESPAIRAIVTAVIGGSVLTEVLVQIGARRGRATSPPPPSPEALALAGTGESSPAASESSSAASAASPARDAGSEGES